MVTVREPRIGRRSFGLRRVVRVRRFRMAAQAGDAAALRELLAPDAVVVVESDDPGEAVRVFPGRDAAATILARGLRVARGVVVSDVPVNGRAGILVTRDGVPTALLGVDFDGGLVRIVWVRVHPELLRRGNRV